MLSTLKRRGEAIVLPRPQKISPRDFVQLLAGLCESRYVALSHYPNSVEPKKFDAIWRIRETLADCRLHLNDKYIIKTCLRLEIEFHTIAPAEPNKLRKTYINKLNECMNACREYLSWRAQR